MVNMTTCGSWYVGRKETVTVREREMVNQWESEKNHPTASLHLLKDRGTSTNAENLKHIHTRPAFHSRISFQIMEKRVSTFLSGWIA